MNTLCFLHSCRYSLIFQCSVMEHAKCICVKLLPNKNKCKLYKMEILVKNIYRLFVVNGEVHKMKTQQGAVMVQIGVWTRIRISNPMATFYCEEHFTLHIL